MTEKCKMRNVLNNNLILKMISDKLVLLPFNE